MLNCKFAMISDLVIPLRSKSATPHDRLCSGPQPEPERRPRRRRSRTLVPSSSSRVERIASVASMTSMNGPAARKVLSRSKGGYQGPET